MQITRRFTREGQDPFTGLTFAARSSVIRNPNGSVVFEMKDVMVPETWSQVAVDILAQKYFRRAGVPGRFDRVHEAGVPAWLQRSTPETPDTPTGGDRLAAGFTARRVLTDPLGLEGRVLHLGGRRARVPRRDLLHARGPDGGPE